MSMENKQKINSKKVLMNYLNTGIIVCFVTLLSCTKKSDPSTELSGIIANMDNREAYDKKEYPLGLFTKEFYQSEADFAKDQLAKLSNILIESLSETEKISIALLQFTLQE